MQKVAAKLRGRYGQVLASSTRKAWKLHACSQTLSFAFPYRRSQKSQLEQLVILCKRSSYKTLICQTYASKAGLCRVPLFQAIIT